MAKKVIATKKREREKVSVNNAAKNPTQSLLAFEYSNLVWQR